MAEAEHFLSIGRIDVSANDEANRCRERDQELTRNRVLCDLEATQRSITLLETELELETGTM